MTTHFRAPSRVLEGGLALATIALIAACTTQAEEPSARSTQRYIKDEMKSKWCDDLKNFEDGQIVQCTETPPVGCTLSPGGQAAYALRAQLCENEDAIMCGDGDLKKACEAASGKLFTCCGGGCVDLYADPQNCGACGKQCGDDQICSAGNCLCADDMLKDPSNCKGDPPPPPQATCADIASAHGWADYRQNDDCNDALEVVSDDTGNRCCPYIPPDPCPDCG